MSEEEIINELENKYYYKDWFIGLMYGLWFVYFGPVLIANSLLKKRTELYKKLIDIAKNGEKAHSNDDYIFDETIDFRDIYKSLDTEEAKYLLCKKVTQKYNNYSIAFIQNVFGTTTYETALLAKKLREDNLYISNTLSSAKYYLSNVRDGRSFEIFIASLLNDLGYEAEATKASNDFGVDVIAEKNKIKYAIQCKYYSNHVGLTAVQEVITGKNYYNCHVAVVATNNYFTKQAQQLAKQNNVILWDEQALLSMINKANEK